MIDERKRTNSTKHSRSYGAENLDRLQPSRVKTKPKNDHLKPSIVFFGNEQLATGVSTEAPTLRGLLSAGYPIAAVVINSRPVTSRSSRASEAVNIAKANNIPVLEPQNLSEIKDKLKSFKAEIGVLVAFGAPVPDEILEVFPAGIINIHPSLLPKHRGPTPIESVLLQGEEKTGVTIMKLASDMDAGPIYAQEEVTVKGKVTKQELADRLSNTGAKLLLHLLPAIVKGELKAWTQDNSEATYDKKIEKDDGLIDWSKPADVLEREIRAYAGWPKSRTKIDNYDVIIKEADVINATGKPGDFEKTKNLLMVYCVKDALSIKSIQPVGKKEMLISAFLAGYKL